MKNILYILVFGFLLISCSSKKDFEFTNKTFVYKIDKNILISSIDKKKDSPVSFSLGIFSGIGKHLSLGTSGTYRPKVANNKALLLEKSILLYNINLSSLLRNEINKQLLNKTSNNNFTHIIHLSLLSYDLDSNIFSKKYQIKLKIKLLIMNSNNKKVYENTEVYAYNSDYDSYTKEEILQNKDNLVKAFTQSIKANIKKLINTMEKV